MDTYRYAAATVQKSRLLYRLLVSGQRPKRKACMTYGEAGKAIGMHVRPLRFALHKAQDECREKGLPSLTVLVVRKSGGLPGEGCDNNAPGEFVEALEEVSRYNWPAEPWW
jgi:hypothetical protein